MWLSRILKTIVSDQAEQFQVSEVNFQEEEELMV